MVLLHPALVLIDHGHFQYNSICLGLAMASAAAVTSGERGGGEINYYEGSEFLNLAPSRPRVTEHPCPARSPDLLKRNNRRAVQFFFRNTPSLEQQQQHVPW